MFGARLEKTLEKQDRRSNAGVVLLTSHDDKGYVHDTKVTAGLITEEDKGQNVHLDAGYSGLDLVYNMCRYSQILRYNPEWIAA